MNSLRLLALALFAMVLGACSSPAPESKQDPNSTDAKNSATGTPAAPTKVSLLLNWFPEAEHGGFYAALVHGYYKEAGLDVEILSGGVDIPVIPRVATGDAAFGVCNADDVVLGAAQQSGVLALMAPIQNSPRCILVHADSGIERLDQLKDLTLAMSSRAAFSHFLRAKLPLDNVKVVPYPGNVTPFLVEKRYAIQGYSFSEPHVIKSRGGDARALMVSEMGWNPYTSVLVTSQDLIRKDPELVSKMVGASLRGWEKYLAEPAETNAHIHGLNREMDLEILDFGAKEIAKLATSDATQTSGLGAMTHERWDTLVSQMREIGLVKEGAVKADDIQTTRFLPAKAASK